MNTAIPRRRFSENVEYIQVRVSTLSGRTFEFEVESSSHVREVKRMITGMESAFRVPAMRLFSGDKEVQDHALISSIISTTSQRSSGSLLMLTMVIRLPEFEQFLLDPHSLRKESSYVQADKECVLVQVKNQPLDLRYASPELRNDKDVVSAAVKINGRALRYAGEDLQDNIDIVVAALGTRAKCLCFASSRLRKMPELVLLATRGYRVLYCLLFALIALVVVVWKWNITVLLNVLIFLCMVYAMSSVDCWSSQAVFHAICCVPFYLIFWPFLMGMGLYFSDLKLQELLVARAKRVTAQSS